MNIIRKSFELNPKDYYVKHISIVNAVLTNSLTNKEIEVLASFMVADSKLTEDDRFNTLVRKQVMKDLSLSPGGLGNYLKSMIKKGFLNKSKITNRITILEYLMPDNTGQGYQFKLIKKEE